MGHTNSTPNIGLPQFIGTDKPTWLGDVNGAMSTIDTKVGSIDAAIATTDAKADNAVADASGAVTTATNAVNTAGAASTTATQANNLATQALTVANNTADLCTDQIVPDVQANKTAIGTLADLQTTAKDNLVNAINEVAQGGGGGTLPGWTFAGNALTGGSAVTLPATWKDCYVVASNETVEANFAGGVGMFFGNVGVEYTNTNGASNQGASASTYVQVNVNTNNEVTFVKARYNSASDITGAIAKVYYR